MTQRANQPPVPVTIVTGFLGSGKTTLLNHLLRVPDLADTAVIVNEFGEVGLDHLLIEQAIENAVLLKNGCICCTVRGDIADTLEMLFDRRERGEIPYFRRIAIETTGLADPGPVAHTLVEEGGAYACRLAGIVTTLDALHGVAQLRDRDEARKQVAMADRILLTKGDLAGEGGLASVMRAVRTLNAVAPVQAVLHGEAAADDVFGLEPEASLAAHSLHTEPHDHDHGHTHDDALHAAGIGATVVRHAGAVPWPGLRLWLDSLLSVRGEDVLRLKGVVRLAGHDRPMVLQGVHHVLHPPSPLPASAPAPETSEIVVIGVRLPAAGLQASFDTAMAAADSLSGPSSADFRETGRWR
jgi:G3E family GTPase